mgnify:CR=1 FL=1
MDWAEKEVASLELSKKLKELEFPQNREGWYWIKTTYPVKWILAIMLDGIWLSVRNYIVIKDEVIEEIIKAPTNSELGKWLPPYWISWRDKKGRYWISRIREFKCVFNSEDYPELSRPIAVALENFIKREYTPTNNEANARAKLLIFLKEIGYLTFKQGDTNAQSRQQIGNF